MRINFLEYFRLCLRKNVRLGKTQNPFRRSDFEEFSTVAQKNGTSSVPFRSAPISSSSEEDNISYACCFFIPPTLSSMSKSSKKPANATSSSPSVFIVSFSFHSYFLESRANHSVPFTIFQQFFVVFVIRTYLFHLFSITFWQQPYFVKIHLHPRLTSSRRKVSKFLASSRRKRTKTCHSLYINDARRNLPTPLRALLNTRHPPRQSQGTCFSFRSRCFLVSPIYDSRDHIELFIQHRVRYAQIYRFDVSVRTYRPKTRSISRISIHSRPSQRRARGLFYSRFHPTTRSLQR